jgi:regulator of protease activity HflC (stomatin/prohibitin superfamily)
MGWMNNAAEIVVGALVELVFLTVVLAVLYRVGLWFSLVPKRQIVPEFQRCVVLRNGRVEKILEPGAHWVSLKGRLILCDARPTPFQLGQEMLTSDGLAVRVSLGGEYVVKDPASFVTESTDSFGVFFLELRQALRLAVGEIPSAKFLAGQAELPDRLRELLAPRGSQLGIELTRIEVLEAIPIGWLRAV